MASKALLVGLSQNAKTLRCKLELQILEKMQLVTNAMGGTENCSSCEASGYVRIGKVGPLRGQRKSTRGQILLKRITDHQMIERGLEKTNGPLIPFAEPYLLEKFSIEDCHPKLWEN